MSQNKEDLKNKIIYRASYRGTKEMDILMTAFVKSFIEDLNEDTLKILDTFVNMDDETLISFKKKNMEFYLSNEKLVHNLKKLKSAFRFENLLCLVFLSLQLQILNHFENIDQIYFFYNLVLDYLLPIYVQQCFR